MKPVLVVIACILGTTLWAQSVFIQAGAPATLSKAVNEYSYWKYNFPGVSEENVFETTRLVNAPSLHVGLSVPLNDRFYALTKLGLYGRYVHTMETNNTSSYSVPMLMADLGIGAQLSEKWALETSLGLDAFGSASNWSTEVLWKAFGIHHLYAGLTIWRVSCYVNNTTYDPNTGDMNYGGYDEPFPMISGHIGWRLALDPWLSAKSPKHSEIQTF